MRDGAHRPLNTRIKWFSLSLEEEERMLYMNRMKGRLLRPSGEPLLSSVDARELDEK